MGLAGGYCLLRFQRRRSATKNGVLIRGMGPGTVLSGGTVTLSGTNSGLAELTMSASYQTASTDLSALAGDLWPSADDTYDIGSTTHRWSEGHFSDLIRIGLNPNAQTNPNGRSFVLANDFSLESYIPAENDYDTAPNIIQKSYYFPLSGVLSFHIVQLWTDIDSPSGTTWRWNIQVGSHTIVFNQDGGVYPSTDNTGSLGISGNTWGDIYATLPTSDPGNNGMWVNAANHNAVTIGSGA